MKISTKGRYALRLMLDLASDTSNSYVAIKTIASRQEISEKYLEQIINHLSKAKLVISARGAQGGYKLAKPVEKYSIGEIIRATEGSLAPVQCLEKDGSPCKRAKECVTLDLWKDLETAVNELLDKRSLIDLVNKQKELNALKNG